MPPALVEPCGEPADLGGGVVIACTRYDQHPLPHEAPVVLHRGGVCVVGARVQWPHRVWPADNRHEGRSVTAPGS